MSLHRCHCKQPAKWFVRVVPFREVALVEGHLPELVLAATAVDTWAVCDEHITDAVRGLEERNTMEGAMIIVRPEDD